MANIIEADDETLIEPDVLVIPSAPAKSTISPYWAIQYIRKVFLQDPINSQENKNLKRIFITRKNVTSRAVHNEAQLIELLKNMLNVQTISLEDYTIMEQASIFSQADLIIAQHGAGLTNLVFARPGTMVIEIFQYHLDETFWILSQQLGLRHYCVLGLQPGEVEKLKDPLFANNDARYLGGPLDLEKIKKTTTKLKTIFNSLFTASQLQNLRTPQSMPPTDRDLKSQSHLVKTEL